MIKQLEYSESVGPPRDQKTARGALRLLGAFIAGTERRPDSVVDPNEPGRTAGQALDEIFRGK